MGWKRKTLIGTVAVLGVSYLTLSYITREPDRPVVTLPTAGKLLLSGVTIVDTRDGSLTPGMSVLMDKGKILSVGTNDPVSGDQSVERVDAKGKFLVPGYNDMHAHPLGQADPSGTLALMLANGITGFRQMSGSDAVLGERRESRLPITRYSPALLAMPGSLLTPLTASKVQQARETVQHEKAAGADFIKAAFVSEPVLFAAIDEGKKVGLPVSGHVPAGTSVVKAAQRGMRAIEHLGPANGIMTVCSSKGDEILAELRTGAKPPQVPAIKSRIIAKLAEWALLERVINPVAADKEAGAIGPMARALATFDEARCRQAMQSLKAAGNWQVPTLIRLKAIYVANDPAFARDTNLQYVPPKTLEDWRRVTKQFVEVYSVADRTTMRQGYEFSLRLVKLLDEEGVKMLAGSDASGSGWEVAGFALHQEFEELAKAGLSPLRILQMTTIDGAEFLGKTATMGTVAPGRNADLVLLDADPTKSVGNLRRIAGVVRAGFYYDAAKLESLKARVKAGQGYLK